MSYIAGIFANITLRALLAATGVREDAGWLGLQHPEQRMGQSHISRRVCQRWPAGVQPYSVIVRHGATTAATTAATYAAELQQQLQQQVLQYWLPAGV